jgi:hypothetical protein
VDARRFVAAGGGFSRVVRLKSRRAIAVNDRTAGQRLLLEGLTMQNGMSLRTGRFGRGGSMAQSREPMTLDAIRTVAPSVFAESRHSSRTERFTYIPTSQIVEHLMGRDFGVFSVMQGGSRDDEKRGFTKHLVRFRPLSQPVQAGGTFNEIILINAHDGTSSYRLMAGVFRLVCSNGLTVAESLIEDCRIKHSGDILGDVSGSVVQIAGKLPQIGHAVESMKAIELAPAEREVFARAALVAKYGDDQPPVTVPQVLTPRRSEDRAPDLWSTLNVAQEALLQGGQRYRLRTNRGVQDRRTQPVRSVDGTTNLNRALWQLAEEMRRLKA